MKTGLEGKTFAELDGLLDAAFAMEATLKDPPPDADLYQCVTWLMAARGLASLAMTERTWRGLSAGMDASR